MRLTKGDAAASGAVALAAFLPFLRGALQGASFYFRDLSVQFFPVRRFAVEGLRAGQLRYWNPYAYEGVALSPLPLGYPLDLLQALRPDESFFSLLLALHLPLAAVAAYLLARRLGAGPAGAATAGLGYALGGFALSTVNLYVYCEALPWVAFVVLALVRAAPGGRREVGWAALAVGVLLSTTAAEFAVQAVVAGVVLAPWPLSRGAASRLAGSVVLGTGLAAAVLGPASAAVVGSARGAGFPPDVVLAHSVHPLALVQVLVAGLFGDPSRLAERFWGMNFFPRGFPYVLSLYLGAIPLGLAVAGVCALRRPAGRLLLLLALALLVALGRWAGLQPVVEALVWVRTLRFPVKAFLTAHLAIALLASLGADAIAAGERRALRAFAAVALALGLALAGAPTLLGRLEAVGDWLLRGFFPPDLAWPLRLAYAREIGADAAIGGAVAACAGGLALLALRGHLRPAVVAWAVTVLLGADLLRAGAGLNPMVTPAFLRPSPEVEALAARLRADGGRLCPLDPSYSPAYERARAARTRHELWSFAVVEDTLSPDTNLHDGVATALTPDRTMLVPTDRVLPPEAASPRALPALLPRLRESAVSHVLSLDSLAVDGLTLEQSLAPPRLVPLRLALYRVDGAKALAEVAGPGGDAGRVISLQRRGDRLAVEVEVQEDARLLLREGLSRGWRAQVDGRPAAIEPVGPGAVMVLVGTGRHRVTFDYRPPLLFAGALISAAALAAIIVLGVGRPRSADADPQR